MDCKTCKERKPDSVPYLAYESAMARLERINRHLTRALIAAVLVILAIVCAFLYVWQLYDYSSEEMVYTYQQDGEGVNIIGDRNGVDYNGPICDSSCAQTDSNP